MHITHEVSRVTKHISVMLLFFANIYFPAQLALVMLYCQLYMVAEADFDALSVLLLVISSRHSICLYFLWCQMQCYLVKFVKPWSHLLLLVLLFFWVSIHHLTKPLLHNIDNVDLGTACGKYYRVCCLSIIDPGIYFV